MRKGILINEISSLIAGEKLPGYLAVKYRADLELRPYFKNTKEPQGIVNYILCKGSRVCVPKAEIRSNLQHDTHSAAFTAHFRETKALKKMLLLHY